MRVTDTLDASYTIFRGVEPVFGARSRRESIPRQTLQRQCTAVALIFSAVFAIAGCQPNNSLSGKVTYNGKPVEKGSILFMSADRNGPGFSAQVLDGVYATDKIQLGKHIAIARGLEKFRMMSKDESIRQREQKNNPHGLPVDYIPEDATGNSQTVDVVGGEQTLDFALEGPPRSE
jgi:hypothetical protein